MILKRNIFVSVLCTILILAGVAYLSVAYFLPWYIENRIFSRIGDTLSASAGGRVHRIGPFSAIFGNIRAGSPDEAALSVNSVELDYSPFSLLKKNIDHISINGLVINADITEEGFVLPGLDFTAASKKKKTGWDMDKQDTLVLPVEVAGLDVSNGLIQIRNMNRIIPVLFDLEIEGDAEPGIPFAYKLKMQIVLMGEILHLSGSLDPAGRTLSVFLKDDAINLDTLLSVAGVSFDSLQAGRITMQGQADFSQPAWTFILQRSTSMT